MMSVHCPRGKAVLFSATLIMMLITEANADGVLEHSLKWEEKKQLQQPSSVPVPAEQIQKKSSDKRSINLKVNKGIESKKRPSAPIKKMSAKNRQDKLPTSAKEVSQHSGQNSAVSSVYLHDDQQSLCQPEPEQAANLGQWLRKVINTVKGVPEETILITKFKTLQQQYQLSEQNRITTASERDDLLARIEKVISEEKKLKHVHQALKKEKEQLELALASNKTVEPTEPVIASVKKNPFTLLHQLEKLTRLYRDEKNVHPNQNKTADAQKELQEANEILQALKLKDGEYRNQLAELKNELETDRRENKDLRNNISAMVKKDAEKQITLEMLQRRLKQEQYPTIPEELAEREDFASGMATGFQLVEMLTARENIGNSISRAAFLSGLREAMQDGQRLNNEEYAALIKGANARFSQALDKHNAARQAEENKYIASFKKEKGARQSPEGVWYRVRHAGDQKLDEADMVTVSYSRHLSSGELLEDSDVSGVVMRSALKDYPAPLHSIISLLGLHGEASIILPVDQEGVPDLASTFYEIWTIRITDTGEGTASVNKL